jgi:hypothetical protein
LHLPFHTGFHLLGNMPYFEGLHRQAGWGMAQYADFYNLAA